MWFRDWVFTKIGEDWIFLSLLGIIMALLSFALDYTIAKFQTGKNCSHRLLSINIILYSLNLFLPLIYLKTVDFISKEF